jgi:hypothetical protein
VTRSGKASRYKKIHQNNLFTTAQPAPSKRKKREESDNLRGDGTHSNAHVASMTIAILSIGILFGIILLAQHAPGWFSKDKRLSTASQASGVNNTDPGAEKSFQQFCEGECKFRMLCPGKRAACKKGTCLEYELNKNALW